MENDNRHLYVALIRGIMPTNPNMRNEKLRLVLEDLGFSGIKTVIASGNLIFQTDSSDIKKLEDLFEKVLSEKLSFNSTTIIQSQKDLQTMIEADPFKQYERTQTMRLNVTFLKEEPEFNSEFPYQVENTSYTLLGMNNRAIFSVIDISADKTPDMMSWLEKQFGKEITTRSWNTIQRIFNKTRTA